jgi:hypothetical protein
MAKVSESKNKDKNLLLLPSPEFKLLAEQYINVLYPHSRIINPNDSSLPIPAFASTKHSIISVIDAPNIIKLKARIKSDINKLIHAKYPGTSLIYLLSNNFTFSAKDFSQFNASTAKNDFRITIVNHSILLNELLKHNQMPVVADENNLANYYNIHYSTPDILPNIIDEIFKYTNHCCPK